MDNGASSYRRFLQGDKSGLEELVKMYNDSLIFFINRYVNNLTLAEDLAAETFFKVIISKKPFKETYSFKTWLFKIGRNSAIDYIRKHSKFLSVPIEEAESRLSDKQIIEEIMLRDERRRQVHKALDEINPEYRDVVYLLYFEDMSYAEAEFILKKNNKQIKNLAFRAKQSLKVVLEKEGFIYEEL